MKQYKGYFIDNVTFNNKADIDTFVERQAVDAYKKAVEMFANHSDMEHSIYADEKAEYLVKEFGYTWEQIEAIEIETLKAVA